MPQTWQGKHRCQSAYTSLQVGAKDFTLTKKKKAFGSKGIRPTSFLFDLWLNIRCAQGYVSCFSLFSLFKCVRACVVATFLQLHEWFSHFSTCFILKYILKFRSLAGRQCPFFQGNNKCCSVNMCLQSPDLSLTPPPPPNTHLSVCLSLFLKIFPLVLHYYSVWTNFSMKCFFFFPDIAGTESSWMALSEWHEGQNPQIKKSSQGSLTHAALYCIHSQATKT